VDAVERCWFALIFCCCVDLRCLNLLRGITVGADVARLRLLRLYCYGVVVDYDCPRWCRCLNVVTALRCWLLRCCTVGLRLRWLPTTLRCPFVDYYTRCARCLRLPTRLRTCAFVTVITVTPRCRVYGFVVVHVPHVCYCPTFTRYVCATLFYVARLRLHLRLDCGFVVTLLLRYYGLLCCCCC